jgi:hypothetical protein
MKQYETTRVAIQHWSEVRSPLEEHIECESRPALAVLSMEQGHARIAQHRQATTALVAGETDGRAMVGSARHCTYPVLLDVVGRVLLNGWSYSTELRYG